MRDLGPRLAVVALCTGAAVAYGVVHDQVTVRICLEYFTVFHPPMPSAEAAVRDPTLLALLWGVAATWWAGAGAGLLLALAARAGRYPRVAPREMVRPVLLLLVVMAAAAALAGLLGGALAGAGWIRIWPPELAASIPAAEHLDFLVCLWVHNGSYNAGFAGSLWIAWRTWRRRRRRAEEVASGP